MAGALTHMYGLLAESGAAPPVGTQRQILAWGSVGGVYINTTAAADLQYNASGAYVNEED